MKCSEERSGLAKETYVIVVVPGRCGGPWRARRQRSERRSRDSWSRRPQSESASYFFALLWASDNPLCCIGICMCTEVFFCWFKIRACWSSVTSCFSSAVYKGSWRPAWARGHKSEFAFCHYFFTFTLKAQLFRYLNHTSTKTKTFAANVGYCCFFQGDTGERGTPGEKVWNKKVWHVLTILQTKLKI